MEADIPVCKYVFDIQEKDGNHPSALRKLEEIPV